MKQVLQDLQTGATRVADTMEPPCLPGHLLIQTAVSVVSAGTERMLVEFGKAGMIGKALQQPDKVRQVVQKARTDGVLATLDAVRTKLDQPLPLGYSSCGFVVGVGSGVAGFAAGDRVASNGKHAEWVAVPANLCARVPDSVPDEAAACTVLGAIALQGIRLAGPTLGERFAVIGLGLIGLFAVQLLKAHGCRVLAVDMQRDRLDLARGFGAEVVDLSMVGDPLAAAESFTAGRGVDGVIIAASTTSNDPMRHAARMSRKRGRIVLVGVTGLELSRADFYEKELTFQVSCSYGPGRYDPAYEEKGVDYPLPYVRWTEQRNFEAVLDMMADGRLEFAPLVTHRFPLYEAQRAYSLITSDEPHLGVLLTYPQATGSEPAPAGNALHVTAAGAPAPATIGFIGAGSYASGVLIPAFRATAARLRAVCSATGVTGTHAARRHGIELSMADGQALLADEAINAVVIATRHASHAAWASRALAAGKHVFVEKPLAMSIEELEQIEATFRRACAGRAAPVLLVGFNRRFAPQVQRMRVLLTAASGPKSLVMTVNAGAIPDNHWTQDPEIGGGRILGEACHFIDLLRFLAGSAIVSHHAVAMSSPRKRPDTATINLGFADGSIGTIHYLANGHKAVTKERLEVFCEGRVLQLDNFRRLNAHGWSGFRGMRLWRQDKGQKSCVAAFVHAIETGAGSPIPIAELLEVSRVTIEVAEALR